MHTPSRPSGNISMPELFEQAAACLALNDVEEKLARTRRLAEDWRNGRLGLRNSGEILPAACAGRPQRPRLVAPNRLPKRGLGCPLGRASMLHAIAHIEFNAINLAWDAVQRFRTMPRAYYDDWLRVADEEAYHFSLIQAHLRSYGYDYGDFDAHNGLWKMAEKTTGDVLERMAMAPRVLEARGLDVTPGMIGKLRQAGDGRAVEILEVILHDEIGHVRIGTRWFHHLCDERGLEAESAFFELLHKHFPGGLHGPFNEEARRQAGFSTAEMERLGLAAPS
ncbi:MAG: ferritin-like domain-containing protein [Mariprofundaceae bacterium]